MSVFLVLNFLWYVSIDSGRNSLTYWEPCTGIDWCYTIQVSMSLDDVLAWCVADVVSRQI